MNINFIGSGIKKDYDEDIIYLITNEISKKIKELDPSMNLINKYKMLSELCGIDDEEEDEVISANIDIKKDEKNIQIEIKKFSYENNKIDIFVNIKYNVGNEAQNTLDEFLYDLKINISRAVARYMNEINWIVDEQNEQISKELYTKLHSLENQFRGIINKYMLKRFGEEWFSKKINDSFKEKSKGYSEWYDNRYNDLKYIKSEIFNLQTKDLISMLKNSYVNEDITKISKELNEIKGRLNEKISNIIKEDVLEEDNLWQKYFVPIFGDDIEGDWNEFSNMRNTIAHNKVLSKKFCEDMFVHVEKLKSIMDKANINVDSRVKSLEDKMIRDYISDCDYQLNMEILGYKIYNDDQDVIDEIEETYGMITLRGIIHDNIEKLKSRYEDYEGYLCDIILEVDEEEVDKSNVDEVIEYFKEKLVVLNNLVNENDKELINLLINKSNDIAELNSIAEYITYLKLELIDKIQAYRKNTDYNDLFEDDNEICKFYNLDGEKFYIQIRGWFTIEAGGADDIWLDYKKGEELIERGEINIRFGDFSMADYGAPMPEQDDGIYDDIDKVNDAVNCDIEEIIEEIEKNIDDISEYL